MNKKNQTPQLLDTSSPRDKHQDVTMSFFEHLDELRVRVVRALYVFLGGFLLCYFLVTQYVMEILKQPLFKILPPDQHKLYFTSLFENFLTHLKVSGVASVFFCAPYFFYELWGFISPGLYEKEKKLALPFIIIASAFFFAGGAFAYFVLFPTAFHFFVYFGADTDVPILTINDYYTTCIKLILLFGLSFEFPVILGLLGYLGLIDAKFLRENRKNAFLVISVFSAMFAPPDAISMVLMIVPVYLLFELTVLFIARIEKKQNPISH